MPWLTTCRHREGPRAVLSAVDGHSTNGPARYWPSSTSETRLDSMAELFNAPVGFSYPADHHFSFISC